MGAVLTGAGRTHSMSEKKTLLIWPPVLTSNILPLSIPYLNAYLSSQGRPAVPVFDMNLAYLKTIQPHWSLYALLLQASKNLRRQGRTSSGAYRFLDDNVYVLLDRMEVEGKKSIPWSLQAILSARRPGRFIEEKKKVRALLRGAGRPQGLDLAGLSVIYPEQLFFALLIADELKRMFPGVRLVAGGAQISKHIDYLKTDKEIAALFDYLVVDDGEEPFRMLLDALDSGDVSNIPNLYVRRPQGTFEATGRKFLLHPDDYRVPDFSGFDLDSYQEYFPIMASRGCPWSKCAFCSFCLKDRQFYVAGVDRVVAVMRGMGERYGVNNFYFMDDALPTSFMRALAQVLTQRKAPVTWSTGIILGREFADPELCQLLKKSGLRLVSFGLESVSPRVLRLMNKYHQNLAQEELVRILRTLKEAGIMVAVSVFFGFPTETIEEAGATVDFLERHIRFFDVFRVQPFCLEDGTLIMQEPQRFGIEKIHLDDKNVGRRLGYRFDTKEGMTQAEAARFTEFALRRIMRAYRARRQVSVDKKDRHL